MGNLSNTRSLKLRQSVARALVCTLLLLLALSRPTFAFPTGNETLSLGLPESFNATMSTYDGADETLQVRAWAFLDGGDPTDFSVAIQRRGATYGGYDMATGLHYWTTEVSVGPNQPPAWNGNTWPSDYPFLGLYTNYNHRFRPMVAELYAHTDDGAVFLDRAVESTIDGRSAGFSYNGGGAAALDSLGVQLTPAGLAKLGQSHGQSTPAKKSSVQEFLSEMVAGSAPVSAETAPRLCIPLTEAPVGFMETQAFEDAKLEAQRQFNIWEPADMFCKPAGTAAEIAACVVAAATCVRERDHDNPEYYRVCVDTMDATLIDHTFNSSDPVQIQFAGRAQPGVESSATLRGERGLFDLDFRDVEIQWEPAPGICKLSLPNRPSKDVTIEAMDDIPELANWRTCNNLQIDIDKTCTDCSPIDYPATGAERFVNFLQPDPNDAEYLQTSDSGIGSLGFSNISYITDIEACGENYWLTAAGEPAVIRDQIMALLEDQALGKLHNDINHAWQGANPYFEYTEAVDSLFQPFETGTTTIEPDDIALEQTINSCQEDATGGLVCDFDSKLTTDTKAAVTRWAQTPSGTSGSPAHSITAKVPGTNLDFDASVLISANQLNQHIEARFRDTFNFEVAVTYDQLSLTPPPGMSANDRIDRLVASDLRAIANGFQQFGSRDASIKVRPAVDRDPFVWMNPDASPALTTLTAQVPKLVLDINVDGVIVYQALLFLVDTDMTTALDATIDQVVDIALDGYAVSGIAVESTVPNCAIRPLANPAACEKLAMIPLLEIVSEQLASRFDSFFNGIIAPQVFNQQGDFAESMRLINLATVNQYNTVGLYGLFDAGCSAADLAIEPNQWRMIALPCEPPVGQTTVSSVFGDDFPGIYGDSWVMYQYLPSGYQLLRSNSDLQSGVGYWLTHTERDTVMLDMPQNSSAPTRVNIDGCETTNGCFPIELNTAAASNVWTLAGNPYDRDIEIDGVRVETESASTCEPPALCDLNRAHAESLVQSTVFEFDGTAYLSKKGGDSLTTWSAAWWATISGANTTSPRLLIPTR
jgi:hypothetical protein